MCVCVCVGVCVGVCVLKGIPASQCHVYKTVAQNEAKTLNKTA